MKVRKKILNFCSKLKQKVTSNKKKKVKQQPVPILPEEIIFEILRKLPVKSLLRFRCVCKHWNTLFNNPNFFYNNSITFLIKNDYKLYSLDYDSSLSHTDDAPVKEITDPIGIGSVFGYPTFNGSCNGLVCASLWNGSFYCLWNPYTGDYKYVPRSRKPYASTTDDVRRFIVSTRGFGYDSKTDDYKFVDLGCISGESDKSEMHIYSLRSDSWKPAKYIPYVCKPDVLVPGLFFNGSLHWFAKSCLRRNNPSSSYYKVLIALDVGKEVVREVSQPGNLDTEKFSDVKYVDVLNGCLCMLCSTPVDGFEVWMMKDYGVGESWIQLYKISQLKVIHLVQSIQYLRRIKYLKNGHILLQIKYKSGVHRDVEVLVLYDPKDERARALKLDKNMNPVHYVQSLVSLKPGAHNTYRGTESRQ